MKKELLGRCGFYCGCCPTYIKDGCEGCMEEHRTGDLIQKGSGDFARGKQ